MKKHPIPFALGAFVMLVVPTLAVGATPSVSRSANDWYAMGGPAMHVLVMCSVLVVAIVLERCHALRRSAFIPKALCASMREAVEVGNRLELKRLAEEGSSALARLSRTALEGHHARERLAAEGAAAAHQALRNLPLLATLGNIATMVGLLGTVLGMVEAFDVIAQSGTGDARIVAGGIFRALVTTAAGLTIGIFALACNAFLSRRATDFIVALETLVTEVVEQVDRPNRRFDEPDCVELE